jgi:hypothetical protein
MTERTRQTSIVFHYPANVDGIDGLLPAGTYVIETDEEQVPGLSFVAYRRLQTTIVVPFDTGAHTGRQAVAIDPRALQAALERDAQTAGDASCA